LKKEIDDVELPAWIGIIRVRGGFMKVTGDYCSIGQGKAHLRALLTEENIVWDDAFLVRVDYGMRNVTGWVKVK